MPKQKNVTIAPARHVETWRIKVAMRHGLHVRCTVAGMLPGVSSLKVRAARVRQPKGLTEVLTGHEWQLPLLVWTVEQALARSQVQREKAAPQYEAHSCRPKGSSDVSAGNVAPGAAAGIGLLAVPPAVVCWLAVVLLMCGLASAQNSDNPTTKRKSETVPSARVFEVSDSQVPISGSAGTIAQSPHRLSQVRPAAQGSEILGPVRALKNSGPGLSHKSFFKPWGKSFAFSTATYWTGAIADIAGSRGKVEANPFLRNRRGTINVPRSLAITAAPYVISLLLEKHHPKAASILRFIGGVRFGVAIRNWRLK